MLTLHGHAVEFHLLYIRPGDGLDQVHVGLLFGLVEGEVLFAEFFDFGIV